ncbi:MAG: hypothetical protein PHY57_14385 [Ignavibacterium sp.]|nr:MAG: hypothetical protein F9K42_11615 [Ignavibacterium sp.]MDD5609701.1 hypothetical protein [Ignavibacterium sp.]MDX9711488.1 hypothetical protein [Ignavibacteriaceae bacterium]
MGNIESISFAQNDVDKNADSLLHQTNPPQHNSDLRYSVFGPPSPAQWKFQLSFMNSKDQNISAFNFYKKISVIKLFSFQSLIMDWIMQINIV